MSDFESKLKEENELIKELFNFNGDETRHQHLKEILTNYIRNSNNGSNFFIAFIDFYSKCRPRQQHVFRELVECACSCFQEQINDIKLSIKKTDILNFIMFPEEFPINENKEQKEMFLLLQKDDIDGFISFLSNNSTIDITNNQKVESTYYLDLFGWCTSVSLIDFCCLFGSLKCFKISFVK